jgi:6-phosphofructokinase 1
LDLKDVEDKHGKVQPRLVNINSQKAKMVYGFNHQYITEADYEKASKLIENPEDFDFFKTLNWEPFSFV